MEYLDAELFDVGVLGGGVKDYEDLENKPKVNGVEVSGSKNGNEYGLANSSDLPTKTSDLTNDGDGESAFATESYVNTHGGKIDSISVNGVAQTIDENKNVNIAVPTQASDVHALADSTKYGAGLSVSGTTVQLEDQDGNALGASITTQDTGATVVAESGDGNAYTGASYDAGTRTITFTKGSTFQTAIGSDNKISADYVDDSSATNKFVTADEKAQITTNKNDISGLSGSKQDKTDNSLETTSKTVVGAVNEVNSIAKGATKAISFADYSSLITSLNSASADTYKVGQSFYIQTKFVPDLWIISAESSSVPYTYTTDGAFILATETVGGQQVGYYKLAQLETEKVDLTNVVDSNSTITDSGVGNAVTGMSIDGSGNITLTKGLDAVPKTTTVAGVDLQDSITVAEMQTALTDTTHNFVTDTEKSTWGGKQDALVSGTNIKTVDGQTILGSGDLSTKTYKTFPAGWTTNSTTAALMADIENDTTAVVGMAYLGEVTLTDMPFSGNAELVIEIMNGSGTEKTIIATLKSGNVSPYLWQYTYWVISATTHNSGWQGFLPNTPIDNSPTQNSDNLVKSGGVYTAVAAKQDTLVSGTNIKTINSNSILGSDNLEIGVPIRRV